MYHFYFEFLVSGLALFGFSSLVLFIAWLRARSRAIRAESQLEVYREMRGAEPAASRPNPADARLNDAVDALALELERIGEGQRFLTRVLSERFSDGAAPVRVDPSRRVTPH